ncbi:MAG: histidine kinase [Methylococcales bacterium]
MNLKHHLLIRIVLIAVMGLVVTAATVLYQTHQQSKQQAMLTADSLNKQLQLQLLRIDADFGLAERFPDFDLWKETSNTVGLCIRFLNVTGKQQRNLCTGANITAKFWPEWFNSLYQWLFNPDFEVTRLVIFKNKIYGSIVVTPSNELEIANAWQAIRSLMGLSILTTYAVCLMITVTLNRALAPAQVIVAGLEKMTGGDLSLRLPAFKLHEWQRTAVAINQLVATQEQLLSERKQLASRLMTLQEEERRYLARELHDELGQCLAAVNALAASISQTAESVCPALVPESKNISRICKHMLTLLRGLLLRLRPAEIDELGLAASLQSLVNGWNTRSKANIDYKLILQGDIDQLPEPIPITLFRVVQACLTNIAQHSAATQAIVNLTVPSTGSIPITLTVEDNGNAQQLPFSHHSGIALLGIRERVDALGGQLTLNIAKPSGLIVTIKLPQPSDTTLHS